MAELNVAGFYQDTRNFASVKSSLSSNTLFDIKASFGGYVDSISPNLLPDIYCTGALNCIGFGTYLEKMFAPVKIGVHQETDEYDIDNMIGLRTGWYVNSNGKTTFFKFCKTTEAGNRFFVIDELDFRDPNFHTKIEKEVWKDATPSQGIGLGDVYNFAVWRGQLFFCSGEKYQIGTKTGGVLRYDQTNVNEPWFCIDTGFGVANLNTQSSGNDGPYPFYPTLICFFNDVMYLSGSYNFPLQVKFSEHSNPVNVVGSAARPFLGLLDTVPTIEDLLRPSTFVLNQNGDEIRALFQAGGYLWIASNRRFYAYKTISVLNQQGLPAGLLWLDTLQEHKARTGVHNQKTIIQNDETYDFISTSFAKPSLATMIPIISNDTLDKQFGIKSTFIQETMSSIDWSNGAMGIYGSGGPDTIIFMSGSKCGDKNDITIAVKSYENTPMFTKIGIHANDWMNDNEFTYFLSSDNAELYRLDPNRYTNIPFVYQTGKIGTARNDQDFSEKKLKYIYIVGSAESDISLNFQIFNQIYGSDVQTECSITAADFVYEPVVNQDDNNGCECQDDLPNPFVHRRGRLFSKMINVDGAEIRYNTLDIRVIANTQGYFALHQIGVIYEKSSPIWSDMIDPISTPLEDSEHHEFDE